MGKAGVRHWGDEQGQENDMSSVTAANRLRRRVVQLCVSRKRGSSSGGQIRDTDKGHRSDMTVM